MEKQGFLYDIGKCIGCKACQVACKDKNDLEPGEFFRRVETVEHGGNSLFYSGACNHCRRPLCVYGCPTGALHIAADLTVQHDGGLCIGCGACTWNCPYGAPVFSKTKGVSQKCDACAALRQKGQEPACVQACITHCLKYGAIRGEGECLSFLPPPQTTGPALTILGAKRCEEPADEIAFEERPRPFSTEGTGFRKDTDERFVIIGNGAAGVSAAAALRARNKTCSIVLLGNEGTASYSRPMLTKAPLCGFDPSVFTVFGSEWYDKNNIRAINGSAVVQIDAKRKAVRLSDDEELAYDSCICATGAESCIPPFPGRENIGVFAIRTYADIANIRLALPRVKSAVLIGGGVIGLEVAWELHKANCRLAVLESAPTLMSRQLDEQSARLLQMQIEKEGIAVRTGVQIDRITGEGKVTGVRLTDGSEYEADMVIISCGIVPITGLAASAGAVVSRGIVVNDRMETSMPFLYACGDCAEHAGMSFGTWPHAVEEGRVAGANAAGDSMPYVSSPPSLLFHGIGTCLYAQGDTGKNPALAYETVVAESDVSNRRFLVNQPRKASSAYEKYFFCEDRLTGGVLIGDLNKMTRLQEGMRRCVRRDEFLRIMAD